MNLVLLPFAYLATILRKAKLMTVNMSDRRKTGERVKAMKSKSAAGDFIVFLLLGIPLLLLAQVKDAYVFLILMYRDDV